MVSQSECYGAPAKNSKNQPAWLSGRHPVEVGDGSALGKAAGYLAVDFRLFPAKVITRVTVTGGRFDAANAAPARATFGLEGAHHFYGVMDSAAVAELYFGHRIPSANGSGSS